MKKDALRALLQTAGLEEPPEGEIEIVGSDPVFDTPHRVGEAAATALAAQAAAVSTLWEMRKGRRQKVRIDVAAAALSLRSILFQLQNGYTAALPEPCYPTIDFYATRDGRFIFLNGGYPALRNGLLELLGCANVKSALAEAVSRWNSMELENAIADKGLCGAVVRSGREWREHPQGAVLAALPAVEIIKIGDGKPEEPGVRGDRPLSGARVLDLTHVLAGPTCTRALAEQGAEVLHITSPGRPTIQSFDMDTGHGKRCAFLDLSRDADVRKMHALVHDADIFVQSYRFGKLAGLGFAAEELAKMRPGIICADISCYGWSGPWRERAGWEQLAQAVTGIAAEQGSMESPRLSPCFPNDYICGYLAAFGISAALIRRAKEGGSYCVRVSLCQTAMWIQDLGMVPAAELPPASLDQELLDRYLIETETAYGRLKHLGPVVEFSETAAHWEIPTEPLGASLPVWRSSKTRRSLS
jgi:crotonobetainyl-CoA:carnitine CoA-transferase CaiB-like acyl-CoA transferase